MTSHEDIFLAIGRLQGEMRTMGKTVSHIADQLETKVEDHSERLRGLERFRAVAGSVGSLLIILPGAGWAVAKFFQ